MTKQEFLQKLSAERERLMVLADACDGEHMSGRTHINPYVNRSLVAASVIEDVMFLVEALEDVK